MQDLRWLVCRVATRRLEVCLRSTNGGDRKSPAERLDLAMFETWTDAAGKERYNLAVLAVFIATLMLFGGASRADVFGQAVVRILSALVLFSSALQMDRAALRQVAVPLIAVSALALIMLVQLIPLSPALWTALPGRDLFLDALAMAGVPLGWRPASITPDLTLNALLALLPAAAALSVMSVIPRPFYPAVLAMLLVAIAFSVLLGTLQVATGGAYLYGITNVGSAVGSFANRNHSALFTALALPILAGWISLPSRHRRSNGIRGWVAICGAAVVFPVLLVTGSRGGLLLGALGAIAGAVIVAGPGGMVRGKRRLVVLGIGVAVFAASTAVFLTFARDEAFQRLFASGDSSSETRVDLLPVFVRMIGDYFPFGSGFGSFEVVYRIYEPHEKLGPFYLNEAHNDLAQIAIEGGLAALLVVAGFALWVSVKFVSAWFVSSSPSVLLARVGGAVMILTAASSLFDYPLRTPLMAVVFSIASTWLVQAKTVAPRERTA